MTMPDMDTGRGRQGAAPGQRPPPNAPPTQPPGTRPSATDILRGLGLPGVGR